MMVLEAFVKFQTWNNKHCYYEVERNTTESNEIKTLSINK